MAAQAPGEMEIGRALRDARERAGLELEDVEQRTKIRRRYIEALEDEHWDVLPSAAYAKGFLRTYGELLGLDGEALVDEFRRQVEEESAPAWPDRLRDRRRRPGEPRQTNRAWVVLGLVAVAVVAALLVVGLVGGGDEDTPREQRRERGKDDRRGKQREKRQRSAARKGPTTLALRARESLEVCLVGDGKALIDGQVIAPGSRDEFTAKRLDLRFPSGFAPDELVLELNGERVRLPSVRGPVAFRIENGELERRKKEPSMRCP